MDEHFWPAIYPAIAIGLLLGLTSGRLPLIAAAGLGGLAGGAAAYFLSGALGLESGVASLALLIGVSALFAYVFIAVSRRLLPAKTNEKA
jgi:hypothetical protein